MAPESSSAIPAAMADLRLGIACLLLTLMYEKAKVRFIASNDKSNELKHCSISHMNLTVPRPQKNPILMECAGSTVASPHFLNNHSVYLICRRGLQPIRFDLGFSSWTTSSGDVKADASDRCQYKLGVSVMALGY
jgi:hypothetical protein